MIASRSSNDYLHTDVILSKITEYDIFRYYIKGFRELNKKFCSELREDNTPTAAIYVWKNTLLYKDHGHPEHTFNCFRYIQAAFNCDWITALRMVDRDFALGLSYTKDDGLFSMGTQGVKQKQPDLIEKLTLIRKKRRKWNKEDGKFWSKYYISKDILVKFGVEPIDYYWVNEHRFSCKTITYAYKFGQRYKIYAPEETERKWTSNVKAADTQGWKQLPNKGDIVILTSSLKDIMTLYSAGYPAIAMQSEMQMPAEKLIESLKERFKLILVLYDNDYDKETNPGQMMGNKICMKYGLINVCIPSKYGSKDPSDLVKNTNIAILKQIIDEKLRGDS